MPLLPKKNTLDYNPDSTILASKKLKTVALERMKNPLEDPDQAVLSSLDNEKHINSSTDKLLEMANVFHNLVLRIQNLLAPRQIRRGRGLPPKSKGKKGGVRVVPYDPQEAVRMLREIYENPIVEDDNATSSTGSSLSVDEYNRRLQDNRNRFRRFYDNDSLNSVATPASNIPTQNSTSITPSIDFDDYDDFSETSISTMSIPSAGVGDDRNWTSLIFHLITVTRRMNILVSSSIRPVVSSLTQKQIALLTKIYLMVHSSYNDITRPLARRIEDPVSRQLTGKTMVDPFTGVERVANPNAFQEFGFGMIEENLMRQNQYGDEILNTFNTARQELLLSLTVVINSWKQNTPTGQQTDFGEELERDFQTTARVNKNLYIDLQKQANNDDSNSFISPDVSTTATIGSGRKKGRPKKDTMRHTLIGCGMNFYGEKINESRDIPTIWGAYKNCPTKYML